MSQLYFAYLITGNTMFNRYVIISLLMCSTASVTAGVLSKDTWVASGCEKPQDPPFIDASSLDSYNTSITATNEWQKTAKSFDDCIVKQANADGVIITDSVKAEQTKMKDIINKINRDLENGKAFLEQKRTTVQ
jgi:hypothetical protein